AAELPDLQIVDVRNPGEVALGAIPGAIAIPVGQLPDRLTELDPTRPTVVYCAGGYRSSVAASLLRRSGFTDVSDILGGYGAWLDAPQVARPPGRRGRLGTASAACRTPGRCPCCRRQPRGAHERRPRGP